MEIQLLTNKIVSLKQQKNTSKVTTVSHQKRSISVTQPIKNTTDENLLTGFLIW